MVNIIFLFHAFVIAPLLIYVGYKAEKTPSALFKILLILGIVLFIIMNYFLYNSMKKKDN